MQVDELTSLKSNMDVGRLVSVLRLVQEVHPAAIHVPLFTPVEPGVMVLLGQVSELLQQCEVKMVAVPVALLLPKALSEGPTQDALPAGQGHVSPALPAGCAAFLPRRARAGRLTCAQCRRLGRRGRSHRWGPGSGRPRTRRCRTRSVPCRCRGSRRGTDTAAG